MELLGGISRNFTYPMPQTDKDEEQGFVVMVDNLGHRCNFQGKKAWLLCKGSVLY